MSNAIYRMSTAGGVTSETRYPNMLTNYGDFGALKRIAYATNGSANFGNIPQTYQDLYLVSQVRGVNANTIEYFFSTLNSSTAAIYSYTSLQGDGSSATSSRTNVGNTGFFLGVGPGANSTSGIFASLEMWVLNYTNTSTFKTVLYRFAADQNGSGETRLGVGLFASTAAINALNCFGANGTGTGTTHSLYGIKASAA